MPTPLLCDEHATRQRGDGCFTRGFSVRQLLSGLGQEGFPHLCLARSHATSCHVCPSCEEQLHAALAPRAEPARGGCAVCEDWLSARPGTPRTYSVLGIGAGESQNPTGTRYRGRPGACCCSPCTGPWEAKWGERGASCGGESVCTRLERVLRFEFLRFL